MLIGATSQIGFFLMPRLLRAGFSVHAISRRVQPDFSAVRWQRVDIEREPKKLRVYSSVNVIHLAPLWSLPSLIPVLAAQGIKRLIAFGSTSRFSKMDSPVKQERDLARALQDAEEELIDLCARNGMTWTLFRPTLVYGCGLDRNVSRMARFIRRFGFAPLMGSGSGLRQPVHADDLAAAAVAALQNPATCHRAYNLGGGETLTYKEMLVVLFAAYGKTPCFMQVSPRALALLLPLIGLLPRYRDVRKSMFERMNEHLCIDDSAARRDFAYAPRPFIFTAEQIGIAKTIISNL